jgi:hypothetical protein
MGGPKDIPSPTVQLLRFISEPTNLKLAINITSHDSYLLYDVHSVKQQLVNGYKYYFSFDALAFNISNTSLS